MHSFLYGIKCAFLTACGGSLSTCLPLLPFDGDEHKAANSDLQQTIEGDLPPTQRGEEEAVNIDLQPVTLGHDEKEKSADNFDLLLQPTEEGHHEEEGTLPPNTRGEEKYDAGELLPTSGDQHQAENTALLPHEEGDDLLPLSGEEVGDILPMQSEDKEGESQPIGSEEDASLPTNRMPKTGASLSFTLAEFHSHIHDGAPSKIFFMKIMLVALAKPGDCVLYDDPIVNHGKPRVLPKVKKKTYVLLCRTINMPFHPGEYGHDGSTPQPHPHHEPYSMILSNDVTPQATLMVAYIITMFTYQDAANHQAATCLTTNNSSSFPDSAENEDITSLSFGVRGSVPGHDDELQTDLMSVYLLFTPLRGRNKYQGHEKHDQLKTPCVTALKMKTSMQMEIFYLNKDLLDPG